MKRRVLSAGRISGPGKTGLAAGLMVMVLAGCGGQNTDTDSASVLTNVKSTPAPAAAGAKKYTFAIVPKMTNNPVFAIAHAGALHEAAILGDTDIIYQGGASGSGAEQAQVITDLTRKKVSGISVSCIDANAIRGSVNDAVQAGIPVMCFDSDALGAKRLTIYSVSDETVGAQLANLLVMAAGGKQNMKGEVGIMSGTAAAPNLQSRVKGAEEVLSKFPDIKVLPVFNCNDDASLSIDQIRTAMLAHPGMRGWIFVGGWPLFKENALEAIKNPETKVVSMDSLSEEWKYLENGQVYCLVGQKLFGWGEQSVKILHDYASGKELHPPDRIDSGYDLVFNNPTPDQLKLASANVKVWSLADYKKQWAEWNKSSNTSQ